MLIFIPQAGKSIPLEGIISIDIVPDENDQYETEDSCFIIAYYNDCEITLNSFGHHEDAHVELQEITDHINTFLN